MSLKFLALFLGIITFGRLETWALPFYEGVIEIHTAY